MSEFDAKIKVTLQFSTGSSSQLFVHRKLSEIDLLLARGLSLC